MTDRKDGIYVVKAGTGGEVMVIEPNGKVGFMRPIAFLIWLWRALRAGAEVKVDD